MYVRIDHSADDVVRVEVSVEDVDGRGEQSESDHCEQQLQRVETQTHRYVIVPVGQVRHRANTQYVHSS